MLVLGSQNSSNSQRLAELARESSSRTYLIDGPDDIDLAWLQPDDTVLITAGASAPETVVEQCVGLLTEHFAAAVEPLDPRGRSLLPTPQRVPPDRRRPQLKNRPTPNLVFRYRVPTAGLSSSAGLRGVHYLPLASMLTASVYKASKKHCWTSQQWHTRRGFCRATYVECR